MPILSIKTIKISCTVASILLLVIGLFHASGIAYINEMVQTSNVAELVKNIFPVLFIAPSTQLIGLGVIGLFAIKAHPNYHILFTLAALVLFNAIFAFWLNALIPGVVLMIPSVIYLAAGWSSKQKR